MKTIRSDAPLELATDGVLPTTTCSISSGIGAFLLHASVGNGKHYTPQAVRDYVVSKSLLPCPHCGADARTWIDVDEPVTYCRKNCVKGMRFYRKSASASARAWNDYAKTLTNPPFGS